MHQSAPVSKERLLRLPEVEARTGLKKSAIYLRMRDGSFPACRSLGGRAVAWPESQIDAWVARVVDDQATTARPSHHA